MSAQEKETDRFNRLVERMNSEGGSIGKEKKYSEEEKEEILKDLENLNQNEEIDTKED